MPMVRTAAITGGVDTHADTHVAAALDGIGGSGRAVTLMVYEPGLRRVVVNKPPCKNRWVVATWEPASLRMPEEEDEVRFAAGSSKRLSRLTIR